MEVTTIKTPGGLAFTADIDGPAGGDLVLLLHGFPESRHSWRAALPELARAGYRAVAPDQRGYSAGARPDPANLSNYSFDKLVQDAIDLADASGAAGKRFHLVGHDWGGQVSWGVADGHPDRLASLTVQSWPHPKSFRRALQKEDGDQKHRSRHHRAFLDPETGKMLLADKARRRRGPVRPRRPGRGARAASVGAGQSGRRRGGARLISRQCRPRRGHRHHQGPDALHLGRQRRHGRTRRCSRHRRLRESDLRD